MRGAGTLISKIESLFVAHMLELPTRSQFEPHLQADFHIDLMPLPLKIRLVDVIGIGSDDAGERSFTLLFRGPLEPFLSQGTYVMVHREVGALDLFLVPVSKDGVGFYYEAVFNNPG